MRFERGFVGLMRVCVFGEILGGFGEVFYCYFSSFVLWLSVWCFISLSCTGVFWGLIVSVLRVDLGL
jgi:hypothetical protein